jgi:hypothetical protein
VLLRRICNLPGLVLITCIALLATIDLSYASRVRPYAAIAAAAAFVLFFAVLSPRVWAILRMPGLRSPRVANTLVRVREGFDGIRGDRRRLGGAAARGVLFWVLVVGSQAAYMRAVGIHVGILFAGLVVTTVSALSMLPISLGGYGVREGAFGAFMSAGGLATTAQGVSVGLCVTAQTCLLGLLGIPALIGIRNERQARGPDHINPSPEPVPMSMAAGDGGLA